MPTKVLGVLLGIGSLSFLAPLLAQGIAPLGEPPPVTISNGPLKVLVYLPDATRGFFRGTRFDWAGIIGRLEYANHVFYDRWFSRTDPGMRDWEVTPEVVAGPNTAITGPSEEFQRPLGYD